MKKVLSLLLSIVMLVGCFVALIPSANAAVKNPERFPNAKKASVIYKENFEGEEVVSAEDAGTLFAALGWGGTAFSGISIVEDEETGNHRLQIKGANEAMVVCKDDALIGGGYIVEYTAIMTVPADSDGSGMGFRSSYKLTNQEAGWNFLVKERGNFDFHFHTADLAAGNRHSEQDIATEATTVNGMEKANGSIVGKEFRFRLIIDPENGLSAYTVDLETGEATIVVGMNADNVKSWADSAHTLNDELIIRTIGATTHLIDDIAIYEADTDSYEVPKIMGYQTTELTGATYGIRFLAKTEKKTDAVGVGYKVEYRYSDPATDLVHKGSKVISCDYVYSSITVDGDLIAYEDFRIIALHVEDIPTAYDITFTVTPFATFWSDFGGEPLHVYGEPVSFIVNIPD